MPTDLVYNLETGDFVGTINGNGLDRYEATPVNKPHVHKPFPYFTQAVDWLNNQYNPCHM